jgi:hypothetical protein
MASLFSGNFKKVDGRFCVDGGVAPENVDSLVENYQGALYLCGDDSG